MQSNKVVGSFAYKFIERFSAKGIGLIIGIILARIISPDEFGQLAILTVFISLSRTIIESGFNTSLIQNKNVSEDDYSTVFYLSLGISAILILILYFSAPLISEYYETKALVLPLRVYSFTLVFGAFNSIQTAKLQREMRFKAIMTCSLIATVLSGVLGVVMAYAGLGLWALIGYHGSNIVFISVCMLFVVKWRPKMVFSISRAKILFGYGWKLLVSGILCSLYNDLRSLIIGKKFSTEMLGYYSRGQQIPEMISTTMDSSIQSVMLPTLSEAQDEKPRLVAMLKRSSSLDLFLTAPAMVGLALVAESVVRLLYTDAWLPCVIYLQLICLAYIATPYMSSGLIAIKAIGRSDVYMKLEIVRRIMMLFILAISIIFFDSVLAIAVGFVISSWVDALLVAIPVGRLTGYTLAQQIKNTWKILLCSLIMGFVVFALGYLEINIILKLCIQVCSGVLCYLALSCLLKIDSFIGLLELLKRRFNRA